MSAPNAPHSTPLRLTAAALALATLVGSPLHAADAAPAAESKSWATKLTAAPGKLAFWRKDAPAPAPEKVDPVAPATKMATAADKPGKIASKKPTKAEKPLMAAAESKPAPAPTEPAKASMWSRLAKPFAREPKDAEPAAAPAVADAKKKPAPKLAKATEPATDKPAKKSAVSQKSEAKPQPEPAPAPKRGFMARLLQRDEPAAEPSTIPAPAPVKAEKKLAKADKKSADKPAEPKPATEPVVAEAKPGFFARLLKSEPRPEVPAAAPEPAKPEKKLAKNEKKPSSKPADKPTAEPVAPVEAKPGFFARLWGQPVEKDAPAPEKLASATDKKASKKMGPEVPAATKKELAAAKKDAKKQDAPTVAAVPEKKSIWSRLGLGGDVAADKPVVHGGGEAVSSLTADTFVVTKDESPLYGFGPHQATPPDAYLGTGTLVTVTNKSWGWAEVKLSDGRTGTVARNALRQASASDILPKATLRQLFAANTTPAITVRKARPNYEIPFAPLPEPELPTAPSAPQGPSAEVLSAALLPPVNE